MSSNKYIFNLRPDKDSDTVIMHRDEYTEKCH